MVLVSQKRIELGPELLRVMEVMLFSGLPTQRLMCKELWPAEYPDNLNSLGARIWDRKLKALTIMRAALDLSPEQREELLPPAEVNFYYQLYEHYSGYDEIDDLLRPKPRTGPAENHNDGRSAEIVPNVTNEPSQLEIVVMGALLFGEYSTIKGAAEACWPDEVSPNSTKLTQRAVHVRTKVLSWLKTLINNTERDDNLKPFHTEFLRELEIRFGLDYEKIHNSAYRFQVGNQRKSDGNQNALVRRNPRPPSTFRPRKHTTPLQDFQEGVQGPLRTIEFSDEEVRVLSAIFYHDTPDFNKYRIALAAQLAITEIEGGLIVSALSKLREALKHRERGGRLNYRAGRLVVEIHRRFPQMSLEELIGLYYTRNGSPINIHGGSSIRRGKDS